ncbi:MAG: hypothetical protein JKY89_06035 [Immundisolibacteraceae bacterium]|nr:hypothetical protein [Immundisolibacteraceae bacterium]
MIDTKVLIPKYLTDHESASILENMVITHSQELSPSAYHELAVPMHKWRSGVLTCPDNHLYKLYDTGTKRGVARMKMIPLDAKVLHLPIKKEWQDMIKSGIKKEEYREIKPHWTSRIKNKHYDFTMLKNGYGKDAPRILMEVLGIEKGRGNPDWGAPDYDVYIIKLGHRLHYDQAKHLFKRRGA